MESRNGKVRRYEIFHFYSFIMQQKEAAELLSIWAELCVLKQCYYQIVIRLGGLPWGRNFEVNFARLT